MSLPSSPTTGPQLQFDINDSTAFEIPLSNVSQCATGKNEVTLEFHQNDDTEISLMEVRFYVPPNQSDERQDPVEVRKRRLLPFLPLLFSLCCILCIMLLIMCVSPQAFAQNVLSKADVIQATGDAVCIFKELQCLTPRGRWDHETFNQIFHGSLLTHEFKINLIYLTYSLCSESIS